MSRRTVTWTLWLLFAATLPLPYFMIEAGRVPALQIFVFAALTAPLAFTDPNFTTRFVATLFVAQAILESLLLYLLAWFTSRLLVRLTPRWRWLGVAVLAVLLTAGALSLEVYRAPLSHGPGHTNLLGVIGRR